MSSHFLLLQREEGRKETGPFKMILLGFYKKKIAARNVILFPASWDDSRHRSKTEFLALADLKDSQVLLS